MAKLTKTRLKLFFESASGKEILETMKERMEDKEKWDDFKSDFEEAFLEYANSRKERQIK